MPEKQVSNLIFEMHPGDSIFNPAALLKLREGIGAEEISCNLDPSHLFWQGINPVVVIKKLGNIIIHTHAKDTRINKESMEFKGPLGEALFGDLETRAWTFRVVGEGHNRKFWKEYFQELKNAGYNGVFSIEHEDPYIPVDRGIAKAVKFLESF